MEKPKKRKTRKRRIFEFALSAILPFLYLAFAITDHYGMWNTVLGLNAVEQVSINMNTSYDPNIQRQYRPGDIGYKETLSLIERYTKVSLPKGRKPVVIARSRAIESSQLNIGGQTFEWTAPTTPLALLYHDIPGATNEDVIIVGSIDDLSHWIDQRKADFHFFVQDVFFGILSVVLGALIWFMQN